jgi:hypothetical protein
MLQAQINGTVYEMANGKRTPLPGANVYWEGTTQGTTTANDGTFSLEKPEGITTLVASFLGYTTQKQVVIFKQGTINFQLKESGSELKEVNVTGEKEATAVDLKSAGFTFNIDDKELRKAACCNLSESFETNASVDVSFTDAVTGQKQIEMLGLSGKYALIQRENIPYARGLNASTGLTFMPGPFVESLQLTKGLSSVLNGYESITGQINVEYQKPETAPRLLLNVFGNAGGRAELNAITRYKLSEHLESALLVHGSTIPFAQDKNNDGFADIPTGRQLNITNRYHWHTHKQSGWEGQFGFNLVMDDKTGGQLSFINDDNNNAWGYTNNNRRYELFGKNGYMFEDNPFKSLGIIYSLSTQQVQAAAGNLKYAGSQHSGYFNTIFQNILGNSQHKYRTGISFQIDQVDEDLNRSVPPANGAINLYSSTRTEAVPGAYVEYTYEPSNLFTLVSGVRADYNSLFNKVYVTPRLNLRYMPTSLTTFRLGGGRGQRTPLVVAENLSVLASSRSLNYTGVSTLLPEVAWNAGASVSQNITLGEKLLKVNVDAFYTWFDTKLVTDLDANVQEALFLLNQGSRSFSLLTQVDYEVFTRFNTRVAYKYLDAQEQFTGGLAPSYLVPKHRAFVNLAYQTLSKWKFDFTANWFGEKRLPISTGSPDAFKQADYSPSFFTLNAQINKEFKNGLEVFAGVDNLLNFKQENPIVNAANPTAPYFDTNFTWGPIFGRNIYVGLYYTLE